MSRASQPPRPTALPTTARADQSRNRRRILEVAHEFFARRPPDDVQLEDIAEAAGIGRATLFRHIRSKEALIAEIYGARLDDLTRLAQEAITEPPWESVEHMIRTMVRWMREDRGLYPYTVQLARSGAETAEIVAAVSALDAVLERARDAGVVWGDLRVGDLIPLLAFTTEPGDERQHFYTELLLRGLRTGGPAD